MLDTLSNVKSRLGITTVEYDSFLTTQIQLVSDVIEAYCRRKFLAATYIQKFYKEENPASSHITLFHFPLKSVDYVNQDGETLPPTAYRINKPQAKIISKESLFFFDKETEVRYEAGYDTCPTPILSVLDSIVGERYNKKINGIDLNFGSDVQRISIPGAISIDFDYSLSNNDKNSAYGTIIGNNANILGDWRSERAVVGQDKLIYIEEA